MEKKNKNETPKSDAENISLSDLEEQLPEETEKYLEKIKKGEIAQIYTDMEAPAGIIKSSQNNN